MRIRKQLDTKSELGSSVMEYLGTVKRESDKNKIGGPALKHQKPAIGAPTLVKWVKRGTLSDKTPAPQLSSNEEPTLRISNLLSKQSSEGDYNTGYVTDENGTRWPARKPLSETVKDYRRFFKSPLIASAVWGSIPALGYWWINKFLNPDTTGTDNQRIEVLAGELLAADEKKFGSAKGDYNYYIDIAKKQSAKDRWKKAAKIWLISSAVMHLPYINFKNPSKMYKFANDGLDKRSSMLGSQMAMSFNDLQRAVALNPYLSPSIKNSAMNVLEYNPQPVMTSTNIVNNAIYSGESARTGLPIGRIIASAAVDGAVGYGLGKLFNVGSPKRAGLLAGIGSALYNALSYTNSESNKIGSEF